MKELIEKINKFIKSSLPKDVSDELQKSMDAHESAEYAYLGKILGAVVGLVIVLLGGYFLMSKIGQPEKNRTNSIGIEFALIPSGSFQMGCSDGDDDCLDDEIPQSSSNLCRRRPARILPFLLPQSRTFQNGVLE